MPIIEHPLSETVTTGIEFDALAPGLVPAFEEREAAVFGYYTWSAWQRLTPQERAECVAHYRLHRLVEAHRQDAVNAAMKRKTARQA